MRDRAARASILLVVLVLHLVALKLTLSRPARRPSNQPSLIWIEVRPASVIEDAETSRVRRPLERLPVESIPPFAPDEQPPAQTTHEVPIHRWDAAPDEVAAAAVGKIIEREGHRSLGPVAQRDANPAEPFSIFQTPRHELGDIDHYEVGGSTYIWHNENCYTELEFPTIKDSNGLVGAPNPPKCMIRIGETEPRGDLFDPIKRKERAR